MTLAKMARILLDPRAILEKKACHDLAHVLVDAKRKQLRNSERGPRIVRRDRKP
jgi:hypothetical protein